MPRAARARVPVPPQHGGGEAAEGDQLLHGVQGGAEKQTQPKPHHATGGGHHGQPYHATGEHGQPYGGDD